MIFAREILYITIVLCLNILWLKAVNEITARQTRTSLCKHDIIKVCSMPHRWMVGQRRQWRQLERRVRRTVRTWTEEIWSRSVAVDPWSWWLRGGVAHSSAHRVSVWLLYILADTRTALGYRLALWYGTSNRRQSWCGRSSQLRRRASSAIAMFPGLSHSSLAYYGAMPLQTNTPPTITAVVADWQTPICPLAHPPLPESSCRVRLRGGANVESLCASSLWT